MWSGNEQPQPRHQQSSGSVKILGRDPVLWTALTGAVLTALAVFHLGLTAGAAGAINGVIVAVVAAWTTRPRTPGVFTGIVTAVVALLAEYGVHLSDGQTTALYAVVVALFALVTRQQVSPQSTAVTRP